MDSLNPYWLRIELDSIDASTERWNAALQASYEATFRAFAKTYEGQTPENPGLIPNSGDVGTGRRQP